MTMIEDIKSLQIIEHGKCNCSDTKTCTPCMAAKALNEIDEVINNTLKEIERRNLKA